MLKFLVPLTWVIGSLQQVVALCPVSRVGMGREGGVVGELEGRCQASNWSYMVLVL